jgi:hypothetical protein
MKVSLALANNQIRSALDTANKQITAPMRQAWINSLRDLLAEITANALHYYVAGYEDRSDKEYYRLTFLKSKVELMLNPKEDDHQRLMELISQMIVSLERTKGQPDEFPEFHGQVMSVAKTVLKREWNVVKEPIPFEDATNTTDESN